MPQAPAARFEFRHRPRGKARRRGLEQRFVREHLVHPLGVVGPVGGRMERALGDELARDKRRKGGLHHAALVMALFRPWIRKEKVDCGERTVRDHVLEHVQRIVADDSQIGEIFPFYRIQEAPDAWPMHFHGDEIGLGMSLRNLGGGFAHAGAYFQDERRGAAEDPRRVDLHG